MFNFLKRRAARPLRVVADPTATRADLQIRNLLDDPNLRLAMGIDLDVDLGVDLGVDVDLDFEFEFGLEFGVRTAVDFSAA